MLGAHVPAIKRHCEHIGALEVPHARLAVAALPKRATVNGASPVVQAIHLGAASEAEEEARGQERVGCCHDGCRGVMVGVRAGGDDPGDF